MHPLLGREAHFVDVIPAQLAFGPDRVPVARPRAPPVLAHVSGVQPDLDDVRRHVVAAAQSGKGVFSQARRERGLLCHAQHANPALAPGSARLRPECRWRSTRAGTGKATKDAPRLRAPPATHLTSHGNEAE